MGDGSKEKTCKKSDKCFVTLQKETDLSSESVKFITHRNI